ncbi:MAG: cytochrome c3 family protein [Acidobacteriota bacterium]
MHSLSLFIVIAVFLPCLGAEITQPIAYSHKQHIGMGLTCLDCHITADTSAAATIPSVNKCMLCHAKLGKDKPEIQKVAAFATKGREIPWQRVYQFRPEALVKFRHAPHVTKGIACATCHGDMSNAATAQKLVSHSMGTCVTCHRQNHASDDCTTCHY